MRSQNKSIILSALFLAVIGQAKLVGIYPVASLKEAGPYIAQVLKNPSKTLMLVDIDLTLTRPNHAALDIPNYKQHKHVFETMFQKEAPLFIEKVFTHALMISGQSLIDPKAPEILKKYQDKGVKVIGFTASIVGPLAPVAAVEKMRHQILQSHGLDFSGAFLQQLLPLRSIRPYNEQFPLYYRGILFANGGRAPHTKGDVLRAFLKAMRFEPECVIVIDDRLKNIEEIASALEFYNPEIQVLGLEFMAMQDYSNKKLTPQAFKAFWQTMKHQVG